MADIDLGEFTGAAYNIIGNLTTPFAGVFDGNGKTIANLSISLPETDFVGQFGVINDADAEIRDLGLLDSDVSGDDQVGALVGQVYDRAITRCYAVGGSVSGHRRVGGLVGDNHGMVSDCNATGSVFGGDFFFGGMVGKNLGLLSHCYATGSVLGGGFGGGLVGWNEGTVTECYATGSVSGLATVGGLVGDNKGPVSLCYATGRVLGDYLVRGLVGANTSAIFRCYATGSVSGGDRIGGLVGLIFNGSVSNCYATGSVSGDTNFGGLVGLNNDMAVEASFWDTLNSGQTFSDGGTAKSTTEMQMAATFINAGWDFTTPTWIICGGTNYPRFAWQQLSSDFICPDGVDMRDFSVLSAHFGDTGCDAGNDYCDGTDINQSGEVTVTDTVLFFEDWLLSTVSRVASPEPRSLNAY